MVVDPILYPNFVGGRDYKNVAGKDETPGGGRRFFNATTPSACYDLITDAEIPCDASKCYTWDGYEIPCETAKTPFNWNKLGTTLANTFDTLGDLVNGIMGKNTTGGLTPEQIAALNAQRQNRKILGMEPVTGAVVVTLGIGALLFVGYNYYKKNAIPAPGK